MYTYSNFFIVATVILAIWFVVTFLRGRVKNLLAGTFRLSMFQRHFGYVNKSDDPRAFWISSIINVIVLIVLVLVIVWMKTMHL
jgi:hypothetical protein